MHTLVDIWLFSDVSMAINYNFVKFAHSVALNSCIWMSVLFWYYCVVTCNLHVITQ